MHAARSHFFRFRGRGASLTKLLEIGHGKIGVGRPRLPASGNTGVQLGLGPVGGKEHSDAFRRKRQRRRGTDPEERLFDGMAC